MSGSGRRAWSQRDLTMMRAMARCGWRGPAIGQALGRLAREVDLAFWVMIGRTDEAALAVLNTGIAKPSLASLPGRLRHFVARTLGA